MTAVELSYDTVELSDRGSAEFTATIARKGTAEIPTSRIRHIRSDIGTRVNVRGRASATRTIG